MRYISDNRPELAEQLTIGGKAKNLYRLKKMGLPVPSWLVIPHEELFAIIPESLLSESNRSPLLDWIKDYSFPPAFIAEIINYFPENTLFAVRSSAIDEDGSDFSFAGQFESYLFVDQETLVEKIKNVWLSAFSERVQQYRSSHQLEPGFGIAIIVQEMIDAESSGVAFSINPASGDRKEKVISSVYGLGEGLVSGVLNADHFFISDGKIKAELVDKTEQIVFDSTSKQGTRTIAVDSVKRKSSSLSNKQIKAIDELLNKIVQEYNKPQDIEFAVKGDIVYVLQARPITQLGKSTSHTGEYILWDNSNITESYPGVTTPLTFSFIRRSYEEAYKLFAEFMGADPSMIKAQERVFANTLGLINGRVYYNLKSWYLMLAMLPGYSINARFMEDMMGVKERFDIPDKYLLSKQAAWWNIFKMFIKMVQRFRSLPKEREQFTALVDRTIAQYKAIDYSEKDIHELLQLYLDFEYTLLNEWKAPLLNDFFAMIWFGLLKKNCEKYLHTDNRNIHNDLLCGNNDIISVQPVRRSIALSTQITANEELYRLFTSSSEQQILEQLRAPKASQTYTILLEAIESYIHDFGERCIGELKLETISYTQDPSRFIKVLKSYVESGITSAATQNNTEEKLRGAAEQVLQQSLSYQPIKKWWLKTSLRHARTLVSSRENLRYERTRAFGIVRELFFQMGKKFHSENILDDPRDIFYLTKEEICSFIEGTAVVQQLKSLVELRKREFEQYKQEAIPSERFATYGAVYHANDFFSKGKLEKIEGDLRGIGCCPGRVRAKVNVVLHPDEVTSLNGDILITSSTDPGWVTLFPSASGIIVERGSLLSHSAIVSREMGIPCIVGATGLLKTLKTGDEVEMDGSSGEIKIIQQAS